MSANDTRVDVLDEYDAETNAEETDLNDTGETGDATDDEIGPDGVTEDVVEIDSTGSTAIPEGRRARWTRLAVFAIIPMVALALAACAGYLKYLDAAAAGSEAAVVDSVRAASDGTVAMLSYSPDTAEAKLDAARELLTGTFRDSYQALIHDVVIPGALQKQITAVATIPGAASISANENKAVVMVFVNQNITVGKDAPSDTASAVQVTLDKIDGRWLISDFEPK